ncbi:MAG TPA: phosphotransferase [Anaerolineaceae bacterium]|nr:phosphotransferase [Anaerolineaceae bacterium]HNS36916.1 phosphotransferase [Anaerolineaceae bacterium]
MQKRQHHQLEVQAFLQKHLGHAHWDFEIPDGSGNETYFVKSNGHNYFVKLGVQIARYQTMASLGLTPAVIMAGYLTDGMSIIVQPYIVGRTPSRKDFHTNLEQIAAIINRTHHSVEVKQVLPEASSNSYSDIGLEVLTRIQQRWAYYRAQVPEAAEFVETSLADLHQQVQSFRGTGLVASHNDICNANWLISTNGQLYLIDLESMTLDDPAVDIGAILWWYYPPELRQRFLEIVGYANDEAFQFRMRVRMAMHCLSITLPRVQSFDEFDAASFAQELTDFRAILAGKENPQGYE